MPRQDVNRTTYNVKDLGDQPEGEYLLRFELTTMDARSGPRALTTLMWVDSIECHGDYFMAFTKDQDTPVAFFPVDCEWFMLHRDQVDVMTYAEIYEHERKNLRTRMVAERQLMDAVKEAQEEQIVQQDLPPAPKGDEWDKFLNELGGSGDGTV